MDDLIEVCKLAIKGEIKGRKTIFVANLDPVRFGQILSTAANILGHSREIVSVAKIANIVRKVYDGLDSVIGISRWIPAYVLAPFGSSLACDASDLKEIGYKPSHSLRSGLTNMLRN